MNQESTTDVGLAEALGLDQDFDALAGKARESIEAFAQERPHAALGIAAAVGFVVGGGLTPRRLFKLIVAGGGPLLSKQVSGHLSRMVSEAMADSAPGNGGSAADDVGGDDNDVKPKRSRRPRAVPET